MVASNVVLAVFVAAMLRTIVAAVAVPVDRMTDVKRTRAADVAEAAALISDAVAIFVAVEPAVADLVAFVRHARAATSGRLDVSVIGVVAPPAAASSSSANHFST